jgi:hypothetical protein
MIAVSCPLAETGLTTKITTMKMPVKMKRCDFPDMKMGMIYFFIEINDIGTIIPSLLHGYIFSRLITCLTTCRIA